MILVPIYLHLRNQAIAVRNYFQIWTPTSNLRLIIINIADKMYKIMSFLIFRTMVYHWLVADQVTIMIDNKMI